MIVTAQNEPQRKPDTVRFYQDVKKEYSRLKGVKKHGVGLFTEEYIYRELGLKFYRSPRTIENILFNRV